jgi:Cu2+-exporting ATPase
LTAAAGAGIGRGPAGRAEPVPAGDVTSFVRRDAATGLHSLQLMVENVHCGGCVRKIERAIQAEPDVETGRLNLTTRRLTIAWNGPACRGNALVRKVEALGYPVVPYDPEALAVADNRHERELLKAMAVAGFAASNVMLLAVSVWAGHFSGMGEATRTFMHWVQALIVLPAIAYAGRPFFGSALKALRAGTTNMDVPISLAVILAPGISLFETIRHGEHAYFDSAIMLLFFLLIGRYLDSRARGVARSAVERLLALRAAAVTLLLPDGRTRSVRPELLEAGQTVLVAPGERIGVDGTVKDGRSEIDTSAITGETVPAAAGPGDKVFAGTINLQAPLQLTVRAVGDGTLLAEIVKLMELAEQKRGRFVALADRIARAYAPLVHSLALATFLGWWLLMGIAWQTALLYAIAVLIITCPCALGLAVPAVQVIASGRLMQRGILLKSATALERLAEVDTVVFDKTGTLTEGELVLAEADAPPDRLRLAAGMAKSSRHPLARALVRAAPEATVVPGVEERPGQGLAWAGERGEVRLGRYEWAVPADTGQAGTGPAGSGPAGTAAPSRAADEPAAIGPELWLAVPGEPPRRFTFQDQPRADAAATVRSLIDRGLDVQLLSGDRPGPVAAIARAVGIETFKAGCRPDEKVAHLEALAAAGRRVMMVGDGLNDAPALAAAHVSLSPSSAVDISQTTADVVFQGRLLAPVLMTLDTAARTRRLVKQNLAMSFGYNVLTVPIAVMGFVTPLIAALAMSASSLAVVGNALRLNWVRESAR